MKKTNLAKEHYQRLRLLSCEELWEEEVAEFDRAESRGRLDRVAVVRAVGVVFSESGTPEQQAQAMVWLRGLLNDPEEKVRRYAMTALPKLGGGVREEADLLNLLAATSGERERKFVARTLEKVGGSATLSGVPGVRLNAQTVRKVEANLARQENPGEIRFDRFLTTFEGVELHLHCREGLEELLAEEVREQTESGGPFRTNHVRPGCVVIVPHRPFSMGDVYALRCFSSLGFAMDEVGSAPDETDAIANAIASPNGRRVLEAFTEGPIRYRLEFVSRGHQRNAVRQVADRVYALCPTLLNDSRTAPWQFNVRHESGGCAVELTPRLRPDPRFAYRLGDVPAASHPPLAAAMARLAGSQDDEVVWDPFCGSGLEIVERKLRGGVSQIFGTDRSADALIAARQNLIAVGGEAIPTTLACCDFRDYQTVDGLLPGSLSLIITNPPMGRRVPIPDLPELMADLFQAASVLLRPGGRLVFANPLSIKPRDSQLRQVTRLRVDLGGFACHVEKYVRM